MDDIFKDMEKPFLPLLIANWVFGIGIIQYPIGKPHRYFSIIYSLIHMTIFLTLTYFIYPFHVKFMNEYKVNSTSVKITFFSNVLLTIGIIISGWFQAKVLHLIYNFSKFNSKYQIIVL